MKTTLSNNTDWLLRMAAEEDNCSLSVGGLAHECGMFDQAVASTSSQVTKSAFSKLVGLRRREYRLSVEQLAEKADVELAEVLAIEHCQLGEPPEVRTVYNLAKVLKLPEAPLLQLAGLAQPKSEDFSEAAVRFAARSEPIDKLTREEHEALAEFVKFLAQK